MNRRKFLGTTAVAGAAVVASPYIAHAAKHEILVAEPVHSTGYLPMYIAMAKNYFGEADINVKIVTIETGAGHTNAVLSGQAFAFIGGPEHCAFAKAKGAELRAVVHCVDRGNVYFCAEKGLAPNGRDFTSFVKGKAVATGGFGGTPNSITRYLLKKWNLDAKTDVTVVETANSAILAAVRGSAPSSVARPNRSSRRACGKASGASHSSTFPGSSAPTPIPPSTSGSTPSRRSRTWCAGSCAA